MGGVGDELALCVHRVIERSHRALERIEHGVEADGQPPDLVLAHRADALREVHRVGHVLGGLGQPLDGQHGGAGDQPPEERRQRDAAEADQHEDQAQVSEQFVDFGQRLGELHGASRREVLGENAQLDPVDVGIGEEARLLAGGDRAGPRVDGQRHGGRARSEQDPAGRVHQLLVATDLVGAGQDVAQRVARGVGRAFQNRSRGGILVLQEVEQLAVAGMRGPPLNQPQVVRSVAQLGVDLPVQLVGGEHVDEPRGEHYRDRDGGRGGQGDAPPEAHRAPRST